jgi:hypothetical protein
VRSSTARVREWRARQRTGRACFTTEHDVVALESMLRHAGHLTAIEPSHRDVEDALRRLIDWLIADDETRFTE